MTRPRFYTLFYRFTLRGRFAANDHQEAYLSHF
ncbi:hypothetical protein ABIE27_001360 [Paenibacillus sp. 4624]